MINGSNNIKELARDDDPTVELEIPIHAQNQYDGSEVESGIFDADSVDCDDSSGVTVSELRTDLRSRKKTIGQLQYDIEQLRAKWLGLEAEISARESQTQQINAELVSARDAIARSETLLDERERRIQSLQSEVRRRDADVQRLKVGHDALQISATRKPPATPDDGCSTADLRLRLSRSEEYADTLRHQVQDLIESNADTDSRTDNLSLRLDVVTRRNTQLSEDLALSVAAVENLQCTLRDNQDRHAEEMRLLRFDLGTAENTIVETEDMNSELASELVDACGFKDELERMLGDVEEQSSERIDELQKEIGKLHRSKESYEQKLSTKSEAISVLLAELANKSEQIDSINEIKDVVQEIDDRMSERSFANEPIRPRTSSDRVTRVLIGNVGNQVLRFPLFKDRLTIGRTKDNDIQLKAGYVSRKHAVIQTDGSSTRIIDWGSKNGVRVNSKKISEHFLKNGDTLIIGSARFRYEERKKRDT